MRILVAEDDAILADGLTRTLRQSGYAVDWVKTGVEADSALDANDFDLLILDIGLPKKSGLEVLRRLRARDVLYGIYGERVKNITQHPAFQNTARMIARL